MICNNQKTLVSGMSFNKVILYGSNYMKWKRHFPTESLFHGNQLHLRTFVLCETDGLVLTLNCFMRISCAQRLNGEDVCPPNLMTSRGCVIKFYDNLIVLKFKWHLGSSSAKVPGKYQSDYKFLNLNLVASRLHEILRLEIRPLNE